MCSASLHRMTKEDEEKSSEILFCSRSRTWESGRYSPRPLRLWQPVPVPRCRYRFDIGNMFMRQVLRLLGSCEQALFALGIWTFFSVPLVCAATCSVSLCCLRSALDILSTCSLASRSHSRVCFARSATCELNSSPTARSPVDRCARTATMNTTC